MRRGSATDMRAAAVRPKLRGSAINIVWLYDQRGGSGSGSAISEALASRFHSTLTSF